MSEPELEHDTDPDQAATGDVPDDDSVEGSTADPTDDPTVVEVPTGAGTAHLSLPPDADDDEVAALVAAVTSRLTGGTAGDDRDDEEPNAWRLAARLGVRRRVELPRECRRGGEWSAAARRP